MTEESPSEETPGEEPTEREPRRFSFDATAFAAQPIGPKWSEMIALSRDVARPSLTIAQSKRQFDQVNLAKSCGAAASIKAVDDQSRVDTTAFLPKASPSLGLSIGDIMGPSLTRDFARASSSTLVFPRLKMSLPKTSLGADFLIAPGVRDAMTHATQLPTVSVALPSATRAVAERIARQVSSELLGGGTAGLRVGTLIDLRTQAQRIQQAAARAPEATAATRPAVRDLARSSTTQDVPFDGDGLLSADPRRVEEWVRGIALAVLARLSAKDWTEDAITAYTWALVWSLCLLFLVEHPLPAVLKQLTSASGLPF